ncbi:beta-propeller domain-containing protein [Brevundimonas sp.]|uniref:beta-propeller domain-containing protein n=1 Tax=Brevundimonas sp. TaxID=1871086 RepID=UPI002D2C7B44|nr:beta-propeller domain-containing protein [Brevundimonas sp.]HYC98563.1 beta-propeller domain-containing protein [Brevundimonas sp.]
MSGNKAWGRAAFGAVIAAVGLWGANAGAAAQTPDEGLSPFRSEAQLRSFLQSRVHDGRELAYPYEPSPPPLVVPPPPPAPMMALPAPAAAMNDGASLQVEEIVLTGSRAAEPSITNTQVVGVDEGGIVKVHGDHLVILRRGRLFTVSTAGGGLRPVDAINAYPPEADASGDWYDEMLVSGDQVVVIGYSYGRGGTEVSRFRISMDGRLNLPRRVPHALQRLLFLAQLRLAPDRRPAGPLCAAGHRLA